MSVVISDQERGLIGFGSLEEDVMATPDLGLDAAWEAAEAALIAAQGDDDGFGLEVAYWDEFPDEPWAVAANGLQATGARLPEALQALAAALREQPEKEQAGG